MEWFEIDRFIDCHRLPIGFVSRYVYTLAFASSPLLCLIAKSNCNVPQTQRTIDATQVYLRLHTQTHAVSFGWFTQTSFTQNNKTTKSELKPFTIFRINSLACATQRAVTLSTLVLRHLYIYTYSMFDLRPHPKSNFPISNYVNPVTRN